MNNYKILIKRARISDPNLNQTILKNKELIAIYNDDDLIGYKIGDGKSKISQLNYITNINEMREFCVYCTAPAVVCQVILDPYNDSYILKQAARNKNDKIEQDDTENVTKKTGKTKKRKTKKSE